MYCGLYCAAYRAFRDRILGSASEKFVKNFLLAEAKGQACFGERTHFHHLSPAANNGHIMYRKNCLIMTDALRLPVFLVLTDPGIIPLGIIGSTELGPSGLKKYSETSRPGNYTFGHHRQH
jgi:hypothetical protein